MQPTAVAQPVSAEQGSALRAVLMVDEMRLDVVLPSHLGVAELQVELLDLALRAGARPLPAAVLVDAVHGVLDPTLPLAAQGVADGHVLELRIPRTRSVLPPRHHVADAVGDLVLDAEDEASPQARMDVAVAAAGVLAVVLALGTSRLAAGGGEVAAAGPALAGLAVLVAFVTLRQWAVRPGQPGSRWRGVVCLVALVANGAAVGHGIDLVWMGRSATVPAPTGVGLSASLLAVAAALLRTPSVVRAWCALPLTLLLGVGLVPQVIAQVVAAPLESAFGVALAPAHVSAGVVVALVLGAGPVASTVVDAVIVRPLRSTSARGAVHPGALRRRVRTVRHVVAAVDGGVLLLALLVTPHLLASGTAGLLLWGGLVALVLMKVRGERLADRVLLGAVGGLGLLVAGACSWAVLGPVVGPVAGPVSEGSAFASPTVLLVLLTAVAMAGIIALIVATPTGASLLRRPGVVLDRVARVLLPSLWVVSSGLLPGWAG